jgi:hypothetical protein
LAFITYGHHALIAGNRKAAIDGVILTIILAVIFTALQYFEYSEAGFTISDCVYGSAFYASTANTTEVHKDGSNKNLKPGCVYGVCPNVNGSSNINLNPGCVNGKCPHINLKPGCVKGGFFFNKFLDYYRRIKNYYRRIKIGVKKGINTPTLPPLALKLLSNPVIRFFRRLWPICAYVCLSNKVYDFNLFIKYAIFLIFILNIFFSIYICIVRCRNIRKLFKDGAFDVKFSPLDRLSTLIAKLIACSKGMCEAGGTVTGAVAGLYTIDNIMKDLGYDAIFLLILKL